jgi:FMN reductase
MPICSFLNVANCYPTARKPNRWIVHALRGWPTPFGAAIGIGGKLFMGGECQDPAARLQLELVGMQTGKLARQMRVARGETQIASEGNE